MKSFVCIAVLLVCAAAATEARPKRSIIVAAPVVQAAVPVVRQATVVQSSPTTVTKTEQVHSGGHSSYSYSTETKSNPVVHTHAAVAAAPVVSAVAPATAVHTVSTVNHVAPAYTYAYTYPASYYSYAYSPYHYVVGK